MIWLAPEWLWLLLLLVVVLALSVRASGWSLRRFWLAFTMLLLIAALCRPVVPQEPVDVDVTGSDVIVAVDLSYSMQATDLQPSRLAQAKTLLRTLVEANREDRYGVIGFTTHAIVLSPLTNDNELLLHLFDALDESLIITKGTAFMETLKLARKMSRAECPKVLLLTDGGDALSYHEEAMYAKNSGLQVNVVMLATYGGSTLRHSDGSLVKDEAQHLVVSSRNDAVRELTSASGGRMIDGPDAASIVDLLASQKAVDYQTTTKVVQHRELFYYGIMGALITFLLAMTTLGRRLARGMTVLLLLVGIGAQGGVLDGVTLHRAQQDYDAGHYLEAAHHFETIDSNDARYNAANSYYKAGEYERALEGYRAVRTADRTFKATLLFNIANCYIRLQEFEQAKTALLQSLSLHDDVQARENLYAISRAKASEQMLSGRQEGKKRAQQSESGKQEEGKGEKAKGGGANMNVSAASGASAPGGQKTQNDPRLEFSQAKGALSSRQYELINQRSVHETKPW